MDIGEWLGTLPIVTRYWFVASVVLPLLGRFGLLSTVWMYLDYDLTVNKFHFWRPFTSMLYYPVTPQTGFHWLMMLYFLYRYSKTLEMDTFSGRSADYLYMLLINWFFCVGTCMALGVYFLLEPMVMSVLYVWCQVNSSTMVSFWFGTTFQAKYLPWVLWGFNTVIRGSAINELIGIIVGHIYYFFALRYPLEHGGIVLINTPEILYKLIPNENGGIHGMNGNANNRRPQQDNHRWGGAGARLGE